MDSLAAVSTAFVTALSGAGKSLIQKVFEVCVSLTVLTLFFGMLLESLMREDVILDPVAGAYQIAAVLGIVDTQWIADAVRWLDRPELLPLAVVGSALAGILVFWAARYSGEAAWLLLLAFSIRLGSLAVLIAIGALMCVVLALGFVAWIDVRFEADNFDRGWLGPEYVVKQAIYGVTAWVITPCLLILRLINAVVDRVTFEHRKVAVASGAVPIPETETISVQR